MGRRRLAMATAGPSWSLTPTAGHCCDGLPLPNIPPFVFYILLLVGGLALLMRPT